MSINVKETLKEARTAIGNKDFKTAVRLCNAILKVDKKNYMAHVYAGVTLQEVGLPQAAEKSFRNAISLDASKILAWNGLANYYEKQDDPKSAEELVSVYCAIVNLETNEAKILETLKKLSHLKVQDGVNVVKAMKSTLNKPQLSEASRSEVTVAIVEYIAEKKLSEIVDEDEDFLLELIASEHRSEKLHSVYLKGLYKRKTYDQVFSEAQKTLSLYESKVVALKWLCKLYNENRLYELPLSAELLTNIGDYADQLLELQGESPVALITKVLLLLSEKKYLEAEELGKKGTEKQPNCLHIWVLLMKCYRFLHFYDSAIEVARKINELFTSENGETCGCFSRHDHRILTTMNLAYELYDCLSRSNRVSDRELVLDMLIPDREMNLEETGPLFRKIATDSLSLEIRSLSKEYTACIVRSYIALKNHVEARMHLDALEGDFHTILNSKLLSSEGKYTDAVQYLESNEVESAEYWLELGSGYWNLEMHEKSLLPFLKAAKLDQTLYICYLKLGNFYQHFNDADKARRCYEKAFKINPRCVEAGVELSKMYRKLKMWDENWSLLKSVTVRKINADNRWAYLQLSIHHLEKADYPEAIICLRLIVRTDPENSHCWESLADAYLASGAYTSALKSYQKASELLPKALYPKLQVANIKKILGEHEEARQEFEEVLRLDPLYTPALKGISETCLCLARHYYKQQVHGVARDYAQFVLDKLTLALKQRSALSCLWKILADSCYLAAGLPEKNCCLMVAAALAEGKDEDRRVVLERNELYNLAARCYSKAISLTEENILVYHDLANCYLSHAKASEPQNKERLLDRAERVVQFCIANNPAHWRHWNVLGNIAFNREPKNLALAQHSFIKAVTEDGNSAVAWCNLGNVYMHVGDVKLANEAFSQAQRSDPNYVNSWVGQALIAECAGHEDAMDLFRHSTQLSHHQESAIGYAGWVCRTLRELPPDKIVYSIHNMHAIPVACDALTWYTENNPCDSCAWNMLGLLQERMGLKQSAAKSFRYALLYSDAEHRDQVNVNLGRSKCVLGKYEEAIKCYTDVRGATVNSGSGLALALFKNEQYEESYEAYESALHWLTDEQEHQSDFLIALASMVYLFRGPEDAKTLLFRSTQCEPRSPWGLYATLSLGLLHNDINLAELVLKELEELKDSKQCLQHYAALLTATYLFKGQHGKAVSELSKLVHRHPEEASLWLALSVLLIRVGQKKFLVASKRCAQTAMILGQSKMNISQVLCLISLASFLSGDQKESLRAAQSAVHYYPDVPEGWALLICALKSSGATVNLEALRDHVIAELRPSDMLKKWLETL